jgi:hypothetical protein
MHFQVFWKKGMSLPFIKGRMSSFVAGFCAKLVKVQEALEVKDANAIMWEINSMLRP